MENKHPRRAVPSGRLLLTAGVALVAYAVATPSFGQPAETRCIQTRQISNTKRSSDETFLDFHMRSGIVYRNTLRQRCPGLSAYGIGYRTHGSSELCKGSIVRVARTGSSCVLGSFVEVSNP